MSAYVLGSRALAGRYKLDVISHNKRIAVTIGVVGSFWYARIENASTPFNVVMSALTAVHVWMTENKFNPGNHNAHPPCVISSAIIKNWEMG